MRKLLLIVSALLIVSTASAHAGDHSELPDPGTTPDSIFFGLEQAQESVSLALTFNKQKKVEKRARLAEERLAEAKKLLDQNKTDPARKATLLHSNQMDKAIKAYNNLPESKRSELEDNMSSTRGKSMQVLNEIKDKVPEAAIKGLSTAIDAPRPEDTGNKSKSEKQAGENNQDNQSSSQTQQQDSQQQDEPSGYTGSGGVVRE